MLPLLFVLLAALGSVAVQAETGDSTVVIEADGMSMSKAEFEHLFSGEARYRDALGQPGTRLAVGRAVGKAFALEAEARRRKLDQSAAVQLKIRNYTEQLLAYELLLSLRATYLADEAALTSYYEAHRDAFDQPRVRQLLVRAKGSALAPRAAIQELSVDEARAKANALREKIASGVDFAELAKAESDDLASRDNGGDIGFIARGAMSAGLEAAAYSLPVGALSEVVETENGSYLLRVEERRPLPFQLAKAMIANDLAHRDLEAIIEKGYKLNEAYFGE